jgi:glycosyltransferase involved in cell wall biosynthesis
MIVKNEEHRYLRRVLESVREYIDSAVIIDDGSTDNTVLLCKEVLSGIPLKIIENKESIFQNEWKIRELQWLETIAANPDWILFLDADEIFEDSAKSAFREMITDKNCDVYLFRLYDMWDETHYREDAFWSAHKIYRPFMMRYQKNFTYTFLHANQHCGRVPANIFELNYQLSNLRLKHYGWAKPEDRLAKYNRYMQLDPLGVYGSLFQYQSILDANPNLREWQDG